MAREGQTFFRQGTWMMVAAVLSGVFMFAVHFFSKKLPQAEYGVLGTLLQMLNWMTIPALGLQTVFAQQTAASVTDEQQRRLVGTVRAVFVTVTGLWLAMVVAVFIWRHNILATLKIANPAALWVTTLVALTMLWLPITQGLLQGRQNFLWLGWASVVNGLGRFTLAAVTVLVFHAYAAGIMTGALLGMCVALGIAAWQSHVVWSGPAEPIEWRQWLARVVPLTLGLGASQFQFAADQIVVQSYFPKDETGAYVAAGTLCRALVTFTAPLVSVMFPKIVQSVARDERTDVLTITVVSTALLGSVAALSLSVLSPWVLKLMFPPTYAHIASLIAWFSWCMVPMALANVLINNLMARQRYQVVPWLVAVAAGYAVALGLFHDSFLMVVKTLGVFNLLLLLVAAVFTWWGPGAKPRKQ